VLDTTNQVNMVVEDSAGNPTTLNIDADGLTINGGATISGNGIEGVITADPNTGTISIGSNTILIDDVNNIIWAETGGVEADLTLGTATGSNIIVAGDLAVNGATNTNGITNVGDITTDTLTTTGDASIGGNADVVGTLNVGGATTTNGITNTGDIATDTLTTTGDANIGGNAGVTGTLNVGGATTTAGITNTGGLSNTGGLTTDTVTASGDASIGGNASVTGNTSVGGTLSVGGATTTAGITNTGNITTSGDVFADGRGIGLQEQLDSNRSDTNQNRRGIAMVAAMTDATVLPGMNNAMDFNVSYFEDNVGFAISYARRINDNFQVKASAASTSDFEEGVFRAGVGYQW